MVDLKLFRARLTGWERDNREFGKAPGPINLGIEIVALFLENLLEQVDPSQYFFSDLRFLGGIVLHSWKCLSASGTLRLSIRRRVGGFRGLNRGLRRGRCLSGGRLRSGRRRLRCRHGSRSLCRDWGRRGRRGSGGNR